MDMGFRLIQEQQLKLTMTPQLRQAITILQYSAADLLQYVREQTEQNPLIELEEPQLIKAENLPESGERPLSWDEENGSTFADMSRSDEYVNPIEYYVRKDESLQQYLLDQVQFLDLRQKERQLLEFLIGNVDENGYLEAAYDTLPADIVCSEAEWEEAVGRLQQLEPHGVGARDLRECLLIQLHRSGVEDEHCERVIRDHLPDVAARRFQKIANHLRITVDEVEQIVAFIKSFQPKPGALFQAHPPKYIIPDVIVSRIAPKKYVVQVNDTVLPQIHFNDAYKELQTHREVRSFVREHIQHYQWLMRSIDQRKQTILKVTEAIVEKQLPFFEKGVSELQPLSLREIAEQLDVHESTVSRATNQKYVQTPRGVFELKYFFAQKIPTSTGEHTSDAQVKQKIQALIEAEDRSKPLSDQKIAAMLQAEGIQIARRTVAKYRDQLGILSSSKRKKRR